MLNMAILDLRNSVGDARIKSEATYWTSNSAPVKFRAATVPPAASDTAKGDADYVRMTRISLNSSWEQYLSETLGELHDQARFASSISTIKKSSAYRRAISMGDFAARGIMSRMRRGEVRVEWFPVLKSICQIDPVPPHKRGSIPDMAEAWLTWGNSQANVS